MIRRLAIVMHVGLSVCLSAEAAMMNARIRFEPSATVSQAGSSFCLNTEVVQTHSDVLVIEPSEFTVFQPANQNGRIVDAEGSLSRAAVKDMKELGWRFEITDPGDYVVWMRAWFPLPAGYNHGERIDGGPLQNVVDSVNWRKIDKFGSLPSSTGMGDQWLVPKTWHWYPNVTYPLSKGSHFLHFPANGAWCGGCILDRIVLIKKGSGVQAESVDVSGRVVRRLLQGEVVSRRVKTERVGKWMFDADFENGDGELTFEYSYGGREWASFLPGKEMPVGAIKDYLFIRIRFSAACSGRPPIVYRSRFRVEKRGER